MPAPHLFPPLTASPDAAYRAQLSQWAGEFARGRGTLRADDLDLASSRDEVRDFVDGNVDKRRQKLRAWCGLLADSTRLDAWVDEYVAAIPPAAYDSARLDAGRFLLWVETHRPLSAEERDAVACERGRIAVEERARAHRLAYVRFEELRPFSAARIREVDSPGGARLLLNPTHVWGALKTRRFLDDEALLPAHVLFFAAEGDVRTSAVEREGLTLLRLIDGRRGWTLDELEGALPRSPRADLVDLCVALAAQGILAAE